MTSIQGAVIIMQLTIIIVFLRRIWEDMGNDD